MSSLSHTGTPVPTVPGGAGGGGGGGSQQKRFSSTLSGLSSVETMQKSVLNAFALKYSQSLCSVLPSITIICTCSYHTR